MFSPPAPGEHLRIQIEADSAIGAPPPHPFAAGVAGAAKVLPQSARMSPAQGAVGVIDHVDFRFDALHRQLIQPMAVGTVGQSFSLAALAVFVAFAVFTVLTLAAHEFSRRGGIE